MDKTISLDSLQRLIIMPLKRLIDKKVTMVDGKGLSTNDFTNEDKEKLDGIATGAQVNPTKVSELENDAGYISAEEVPSGLPEDAGGYMQLVTNSSGDVKWAELTHYTEDSMSVTVDTANATSVSGNQYRIMNSAYPELMDFLGVLQAYNLEPSELIEMVVNFDSVDYNTVLYYNPFLGWMTGDLALVGAASVYSGSEPFAFVGRLNAYIIVKGEGIHTISVKRVTPIYHPLSSEYIVGTDLVESDEGKILGIVNNKIGLLETEDAEDALDLVAEMGVLNPTTDEEGNILTDEDGNVLTV